MSKDNDTAVDPDNLTPEEEELFMEEFRRLIDGFREAGGVVLMGSGTTIVDIPEPGHKSDDIRQRYIDAFVRNHENRQIIEAQKECFMHLEAGGYLN